MTFFEFLHRIAEILGPSAPDKLFDYMIHSMDDDGGFLRSRYCYWEKTLPEFRGDFSKIKTALVSVKKGCNPDDPEHYYGEDFYGQRLTDLKMQIFYYDESNEESFKSDAEWSSALGFSVAYLIDMGNGTYTMQEYKDCW